MGELIDLELGKQAISVLETKQELAFKRDRHCPGPSFVCPGQLSGCGPGRCPCRPDRYLYSAVLQTCEGRPEAGGKS